MANQRFGVWARSDQLDAETAAEIEDLGYGTLWIGSSPSGDLAVVQQLLDATSTAPVVRLGYQDGGPFEQAVNTPQLREAYDALVGTGQWMPRTNLGTFPVRFPAVDPPGDDGWHIDASYPPSSSDQSNDPFAWRVNVASRGRALLMLFLLSDVSADAPTRLRVGSHLDVAALLAPFGEDGLTMLEASQRAAEATAKHPLAFATGKAGDVYLCHPFLVHAAQPHRGSEPRFLAQPPLHPRGWVNASFDPIAGHSPVEIAIRAGLQSARATPRG